MKDFFSEIFEQQSFIVTSQEKTIIAHHHFALLKTSHSELLASVDYFESVELFQCVYEEFVVYKVSTIFAAFREVVT